MPELPEVRAHAERLTTSHGGASLRGFVPLSFTALKTATPVPETAVGRALDRVDQRGKYLLLRFGTTTFVVHLMQGGRLRIDEKESARPRGGLARWRFDDRPALLLTEAGHEKRAGVWVLDGDVETQPPIDALGPDADALDASSLGERLSVPRARLHSALRDQHRVAGLGRRLANEVCFRAKLSPFADTARLDEGALARLVEAIGHTVDEGLEFERGLDEMSASKDRPGAVHHRAGQACVVCDDLIRTVEYSGYTIAYCPSCQTGGKILADNTTSRFLK
jgi:formamidopyrimidine-DNA glycosylase